MQSKLVFVASALCVALASFYWWVFAIPAMGLLFLLYKRAQQKALPPSVAAVEVDLDLIAATLEVVGATQHFRLSRKLLYFYVNGVWLPYARLSPSGWKLLALQPDKASATPTRPANVPAEYIWDGEAWVKPQ